MKLSIIIPFVGEYPQVLFTIQSVAQNLFASNFEDFEIIAVDNHCVQVENQAKTIADRKLEELSEKYLSGYTSIFKMREFLFDACEKIPPTYRNTSGKAVEACAKGNEWLKYVTYDEKLSHWNAKRIGCFHARGDVLLFLDAHVIPSAGSIAGMYKEYTQEYPDRHGIPYRTMGTMHLPLTYKILEWRRLIYKLVIERESFWTYSFTRVPPRDGVFEVPCMSTCGMMIDKDMYYSIGGWPEILGIYGGGENFMNYTLAVCGYGKYIYPHGTLYHHGEKRDYHYVGDDMIQNRMAAHYLFGGVPCMLKYAKSIPGARPEVIDRMSSTILDNCVKQRNLIKSIQTTTIEEWSEKWLGGENGDK